MLANVFLVGIFYISPTICTAVKRWNISVKDRQDSLKKNPFISVGEN